MKIYVRAAALLAFSFAPFLSAQSPSSGDPLAPTRDTKSAADIDREWQQSVSKYDAERTRLLAEARKQENDGPYRPDWATLNKYQQPQWYKDAKFGIFIHWGVYSVPAAESEWYPRNMYRPQEGAYKNFHEHFAKGDESKGYKDLIPLFKAEHFDATEWARCSSSRGRSTSCRSLNITTASPCTTPASPTGPSSRWDPSATPSANWPRPSAPKASTSASALIAPNTTSSTTAAAPSAPTSTTRNTPRSTAPPTSGSKPAVTTTALINDWTWVSEAWTNDWLARDTELVEKYKPEIVYFDWWIGQPNFRRAVAEFAAFYYNYAAAHGYTGVINFKDYSLNWKAAVRDFERGQQDRIIADHWQTDTSISDKSWGYIENDTFKSPEFLVHQLTDIVSKNGNLLLNFGPKSDGTIPDQIRTTLLEMGAWLKVNGEAIYGTTPWKSFGEGPTQVVAGAFHDTDTKPYTPQDFRFTAKGDAIYAIGMACPSDGKGAIHAFGTAAQGAPHIASVELLGSSEKVTWNQAADSLDIQLPSGAACKYAYALKLTSSR